MSDVYPVRSVASEEDEVAKGNQSPFPLLITYSSIGEYVKQRAENIAEVEETEVDDEIGVDISDSLIGGF